VRLADGGALLLMLAFVAAAFGAVAAPLGRSRRLPRLVESARRASLATAALVTLAVLILERALLSHDFSLQFVAETTNRAMPTTYLIASLWGGQAGSLLYWTWVLTLLTVLVGRRARHAYPALFPDALGTLLGVQVFFLGVVALVTNPFERLSIIPPDGRGLNPLLLDDGMRIHPPLLLAGYVSFAVPFAFAIAALATRRLDGEWLGAIRRWTLLSWGLQGAGLLLGAWWAYHVLGWGGYWGWDPVENVALLPWLTGTALLHSLMVQERRGMMKVWNVVLALASFCLAVFGTFVVRSGVLSSVHAFADSTAGPLFFSFLGVVVVASTGLVLWRMPALRAEGTLDSLLSREAAILLNNLLLVAVAATTFWGTVFPLIAEALRGVKATVGPQFFEQVNGPILLGLLALLGVGPPLAWRRTSRASIARVFGWPLLSIPPVVGALLAIGVSTWPALIVGGLSTLVAATVVADLARGVASRHRGGQPIPSALATLVARDRRRYGGYLAHLAIAVIALGVVGSNFFQVERSATLRRGETLAVGAYTLRFDALTPYRGDGYLGMYADLSVDGPGGAATLRPERRSYAGWEGQLSSRIGIHTTLPRFDDLYVLLSDWQGEDAITIRVFVNPLVIFVWLGGALLLFGGLVAAWPASRPAQAAARARVARGAEVAASGL